MCVLVRSILGLGGSRTLPRLGCRQARSLSRGAGARHSQRAQHFKFRSGREVAREPGCGRAGRPGPAWEGRVRGAVRGLTTWARLGRRLRKRRCWIARGRTSFAPTDGRPRGQHPGGSGGRAGRRAGYEVAGGGPLADPTASLNTRAGWESALREEARDRLRTRLLHLARRPAQGPRCGQVCQRGLVPRRWAGPTGARRGPLADTLPRSARGQAGSRSRGGGKGGRVAGGRRTAFPQGTPSWQGARSSGALGRCWSRATGSNSTAAARQWWAGRLSGQRAGGRAGVDRWPGEGQGGQKVSGV